MFIEIVLDHPSFTFQEPVTGKVCFETNTASSPRSFQITLRVKGYAVYHHGFLSSPSSHKHPTIANSPSDSDETTEIFSHSFPVSIPAGPSAKSHAVDFQFRFPAKSLGSLPCSKSNDSMVNIRYMLKASIQKRYAFLSSSQSCKAEVIMAPIHSVPSTLPNLDSASLSFRPTPLTPASPSSPSSLPTLANSASSTFRRPSLNPQLPFAHLTPNHASQYSTSSTSSSSSTSAPPSAAPQPPFLSIAPTAPLSSLFSERYPTSPNSPPVHFPPSYYHPQNSSSLASNPPISPSFDFAATHSAYSSPRPHPFPSGTPPPPHVAPSLPYPYEAPPSAAPTTSSFYSYSTTPPILSKTGLRSYTSPSASYSQRQVPFASPPPSFAPNSASSFHKDFPPVSPSDPVPIAGQPNAFATLAPGEKLSIHLEEDDLGADIAESSLLPENNDPMLDQTDDVFPPRKNSTIFQMDDHFVQEHTSSSPASVGTQRTSSLHSLSPEVCLASDCTVSPSSTLSEKAAIDFHPAKDSRELNMDYAKEFDVLINQVLQSL
ncbi:meiosis-specific arrestin family membrane adaptor Ste7 [Schizosaccharomyces osmophilus]|uniref:Meiosis-specific arrestin family membrane adaptor Ste7 n=1 Tax=Schizosaccharomyces osmophilus TaxID=2545709 RepID=A0AAE9W8E8_9SCHI|nr:meiosis-specific arrestin family membrane adaptor Ste7 [Schizosaccharomyces osmophilus]WBW71707.1 meiosis-specific arrestin family membrane adaptor Ste7 [Schizosaccharomyces osmophilus]